MSLDYFLICMDCGESIGLGNKKLSKSKFDFTQHFEFSLFNRDIETTYKNTAFMSHFLSRHLTHELRVFPASELTSDVPSHDELKNPDLLDIDGIKNFFQLPVRINEFDPLAVIYELPKEVIDRLKELRRSEKLNDPMKSYIENPRYK